MEGIDELLDKLCAWHDISQKELCKTVGITFQQIQKYERGVNRN